VRTNGTQNELENWSELFDKNDMARKKAMLFNIIDRMDVWDGRVEITQFNA
jgi:hypothetical protein